MNITRSNTDPFGAMIQDALSAPRRDAATEVSR